MSWMLAAFLMITSGSWIPVAPSQSEPKSPSFERLNTDGGAPGFAPAVLEDAVPLPIRATYRTTPAGDVQVAPAQGDPHFLGFTGGDYRPPVGEQLASDLLAVTGLLQRPSGQTYAFVMFSRRITPARVAQLEALGCRVLGFHPHYSLRVALHPEAAAEVAALPFVRWVGPMPAASKLSPRLASATGRVDVYINVFESDLNDASVRQPVARPVTRGGGATLSPETFDAQSAAIWQSFGWQHQALEAERVEILEYLDGIRAFRARVDQRDLAHLTELDFVQHIEPFTRPEPLHDESTPMILADRVRDTWDGGTAQEVILGIIDSGVDTGHDDLDVIGAGWEWSGGSGPWGDGCGHGSHVAGTILGRGVAEAGHTGVAPGLASWGGTSRLFNAKVFDDDGCSWTPGSTTSVYAVMQNSYFDGTDTTPKPHIVNNSWGTWSSSPWIGSEAEAREVDAEVWNHEQLYVFAGGNEGPLASTLRGQAVAKNAFTVANVLDFYEASIGDPGTVVPPSSRGPAGDGRWKPNIAAPGTFISSVEAGTTSSYTAYTGTSMAAPHVSGVAAQLADAYDYTRYAPHRMASILMATAITKDDQVLDAPSSDPLHHLNEYGAGRVSAYRALFQTTELEWANWGFTQDSSGFSFGDFTVESDVERLVVVMTYHEPPCSPGASQALVNDIDLWIDQDPIDPAGNTGEWVSQQSSIDNTEIRILDDPAAGPWRWKTWPTSVTGSARVSVTVAKIHGDTTPGGSFDVVASDLCVQPGENVDITATATCDSYIASAVFCDSTVTGTVTLVDASTTLDDGIVTDLEDNLHAGWDLVLGDIRHGLDRSASWTAFWTTEGVKTWSVEARSDNWVDQTDSLVITVDGTPPTPVTDLMSTTHTPFGWSLDPNITFEWTAATDSLSGLVGYSFSITDGAAGTPDTVQDLGDVTTYSDVLVSAPVARYFNIRAVDACGNWGATESLGPFYVDDVLPTLGTCDVVGTTTPFELVQLAELGATDWDSGLKDMQFSNDGKSWSQPEPYAETRREWDLTQFGGDAWPGTKTVWVRYGDVAGNWGAEATDTIEYQPLPHLETVSPASGPSRGGNTVVLSGSGFSPQTSVNFDGKAAQVTVVDPVTLHVIAPPHPIHPRGQGSIERLAESVDIVVTTEYGSDTKVDGYVYRAKR